MARVTFEGHRYPLEPDESVLDALTRGGANVPFSCRKGTCHVCLLRATEGDPGDEARRGLSAAMQERGYFLPCRARPRSDVRIERPDLSELFVRARIAERAPLSTRIVRVALEPETNLAWRAGQFFNVRRPDGTARSYSVASLADEDYFVELHVERIAGGALSPWLTDELAIGDELEIQGPIGSCFYEPASADRDLLLVGTSTGLSPLLGIARDALRSGHRGNIYLYHGARDLDGLYDGDRLRALAERHPRFHAVQCVSRGSASGWIEAGRASDLAFSRHPELAGFTIFLCGSPEMVHDARVRAIRAGASRDAIHADPFEPARPFEPDDAAKLRAIAPDPEMWRALREGAGLTEILADFYGRVFEDPRLAPFFVHATKERAIEKQYAFLRDVFSGSRDYFGLRPFNAHHWMIVSDELFDYREALFESCLRRHGLDDRLVRRWSALHETFRREIVKARARGLVVDGVEQQADGYGEERLTVGALCDGCGSEMPAGARGRYHLRTGQLYCDACAARAVGSSVLPPAPA